MNQRLVRSKVRAAAVAVVLLVAGPASVRAQTPAAPPSAAAADAGPAAVTAVPAAPLAAVVRGFFVGARLGGGYMVLDQKISGDTTLPQVNGKDEGFGSGVLLQLEAGYDLTPAFAVELLGGASLVNGTRTDRVRDLGLSYLGLAVRLSLELTERLRFATAVGGGYARADDSVDPVQSGAAILFNSGLEYYVHVRHFSVGLDVSVVAPMKPMRLFVGIGPQVKYTF